MFTNLAPSPGPLRGAWEADGSAAPATRQWRRRPPLPLGTSNSTNVTWPHLAGDGPAAVTEITRPPQASDLRHLRSVNVCQTGRRPARSPAARPSGEVQVRRTVEDPVAGDEARTDVDSRRRNPEITAVRSGGERMADEPVGVMQRSDGGEEASVTGTTVVDPMAASMLRRRASPHPATRAPKRNSATVGVARNNWFPTSPARAARRWRADEGSATR